MDIKIVDFVERMQTPIKKMGVKELRDREQTWRSLWSWIPDEVKYLVYRVGSLVRLIRRDYKGSLGELGEVKFEVSEYELSVFEKRFNETDGKYYYEKKVVKIPSSAVMMLEFVSEMQLADEVDKEEVIGFEEDLVVTSHNIES